MNEIEALDMAIEALKGLPVTAKVNAALTTLLILRCDILLGRR